MGDFLEQLVQAVQGAMYPGVPVGSNMDFPSYYGYQFKQREKSVDDAKQRRARQQQLAKAASSRSIFKKAFSKNPDLVEGLIEDFTQTLGEPETKKIFGPGTGGAGGAIGGSGDSVKTETDPDGGDSKQPEALLDRLDLEAKNRIGELESRVQYLIQQRDSAENDLDAAKEDLRTLSDENEGLTTTLEIKEGEIEALNDQLAARTPEGERTALQGRLEHVQREVETLKTKNDRLNGTVRDLNNKLRERKTDYDKLVQRLANAQKELGQTEAQLKGARARIKAKETDYGNLFSKAKENADKQKTLYAQFQKLRGLYDKCTNERKALVSATNKANEDIKSLQASIDELKGTGTQSQGILQKLKADKDACDQKLKEAEANLQEKDREMKRISDKAKQCAQKLKASQAAIEESKKSVKAAKAITEAGKSSGEESNDDSDIESVSPPFVDALSNLFLSDQLSAPKRSEFLQLVGTNLQGERKDLNDYKDLVAEYCPSKKSAKTDKQKETWHTSRKKLNEVFDTNKGLEDQMVAEHPSAMLFEIPKSGFALIAFRDIQDGTKKVPHIEIMAMCSPLDHNGFLPRIETAIACAAETLARSEGYTEQDPVVVRVFLRSKNKAFGEKLTRKLGYAKHEQKAKKGKRLNLDSIYYIKRVQAIQGECAASPDGPESERKDAPVNAPAAQAAPESKTQAAPEPALEPAAESATQAANEPADESKADTQEATIDRSDFNDRKKRSLFLEKFSKHFTDTVRGITYTAQEVDTKDPKTATDTVRGATYSAQEVEAKSPATPITEYTRLSEKYCTGHTKKDGKTLDQYSINSLRLNQRPDIEAMLESGQYKMIEVKSTNPEKGGIVLVGFSDYQSESALKAGQPTIKIKNGLTIQTVCHKGVDVKDEENQRRMFMAIVHLCIRNTKSDLNIPELKLYTRPTTVNNMIIFRDKFGYTLEKDTIPRSLPPRLQKGKGLDDAKKLITRKSFMKKSLKSMVLSKTFSTTKSI